MYIIMCMEVHQYWYIPEVVGWGSGFMKVGGSQADVIITILVIRFGP